jgi:Kef-type K+ transport system membrane component KefB
VVGGHSFGGLSPLPFRMTVLTGFFGGALYACFAYSGFAFAPAAHGYVLLPGGLPLWTYLLAVLVLGGRLLLRPLFHQVALARSTEFFMATCLFVVIGTGVASAMSGLSMALGAFIAGLLLGETEYRREIEVTLEPFKGLLLGLFFVSIGAELDMTQIARAPGLVIGLAVGLIVLKAGILFGLGRLAGLPTPVAGETALLLGPGGEFAFVMITAAVADPLAWQADPHSLAGLLDECSEAELVRRWERALAAMEAHWRRVLDQGVPPLVSPAPWQLRLDGRLVRLRRWLRR